MPHYLFVQTRQINKGRLDHTLAGAVLDMLMCDIAAQELAEDLALLQGERSPAELVEAIMAEQSCSYFLFRRYVAGKVKGRS